MIDRLALQLQTALAEPDLAVLTSRTLSENLERLVGLACPLFRGWVGQHRDPRRRSTPPRPRSPISSRWSGSGPVRHRRGAVPHCARRAKGLLRSVEKSERFPHFALGAADQRIRSVLSVPIRHDDDLIGTLNLYSRQPDGFDEQAQRIADVTAAEAGTAIITSQIYEQVRQRRDELAVVHHKEAQISQAQGPLMAMQLCSAEQAIGLHPGP